MCVELCPVGTLKLIPLDDAEPSGFLGDPLVRYTRPSMRFIEAREPVCFWRKEGEKLHDR